jgi:hypothetical protein
MKGNRKGRCELQAPKAEQFSLHGAFNMMVSLHSPHAVFPLVGQVTRAC